MHLSHLLHKRPNKRFRKASICFVQLLSLEGHSPPRVVRAFSLSPFPSPFLPLPNAHVPKVPITLTPTCHFTEPRVSAVTRALPRGHENALPMLTFLLPL